MACNPFIVVSGMAFEAGIIQGPGIVTVYGLRPSRLISDIECAVKQGARAIVSFGTAAGLDPALKPGTIIIARSIHSGAQVFAADEAWAAKLSAQLPEAKVAGIAGVEQPIIDTEEKALLWAQTGAAAADMESHHAALLAQRHNLPFVALRVVLDGAYRTLPPAALVATRPDGTIAYGILLASLLSQPRQLPAMIRLAADHAQAKKALLRCSKLLWF